MTSASVCFRPIADTDPFGGVPTMKHRGRALEADEDEPSWEERQKEVAKQKPSDQYASVKLILLEDDPLILECTEDALVDAGFEVLSASTGDEALEVLGANQDVQGMMIDVRLAGPLDGWQIARRVREMHPMMAIIYTTTALGPEYSENGVDRSVLLQKPYTLDRAIKSVREALNA